jgi:aminoglycoside phosphotransferase (APT) family kinase protein
MPDKPGAELLIDENLVRRLLVDQGGALVPDAVSTHIAHAADGWDCSVWRVGTALAVRLPRRALAARLIRHEQSVLGGISKRLTVSGVRVPAPLLAGEPGVGFPWAWSIVPWFDGSPGLNVTRRNRRGWAAPLATALSALHVAAPARYPLNPARGVPLTDRAEVVAGRFASLNGRTDSAALIAARRRWDAALEVDPWRGDPVWIHGDLHPGNLIARGRELIAIIDFGDVTAGDPAYDLAVAWLAFDAAGRTAFIEACRGRYDDSTWIRAHGWAAAVTVLLLDQSDDNPDYAQLASDALQEFLV